MKKASLIVNLSCLAAIIILAPAFWWIAYLINDTIDVNENYSIISIFNLDFSVANGTFYTNFLGICGLSLIGSFFFFAVVFGWGVFSIIFEGKLVMKNKFTKKNWYANYFCKYFSFFIIMVGFVGLLFAFSIILTFSKSYIEIKNYKYHVFGPAWDYIDYGRPQMFIIFSKILVASILFVMLLAALSIILLIVNVFLAFINHKKLVPVQEEKENKTLGWEMPTDISAEPLKAQIKDFKVVEPFIYTNPIWTSTTFTAETNDEFLKETFLKLSNLKNPQFQTLRAFAKQNPSSLQFKNHELAIVVYPFVLNPGEVFKWVKTKLFLDKAQKMIAVCYYHYATQLAICLEENLKNFLATRQVDLLQIPEFVEKLKEMAQKALNHFFEKFEIFLADNYRTMHITNFAIFYNFAGEMPFFSNVLDGLENLFIKYDLLSAKIANDAGVKAPNQIFKLSETKVEAALADLKLTKKSTKKNFKPHIESFYIDFTQLNLEMLLLLKFQWINCINIKSL
ncbi:hypothetical protein SCLARK_00900 [Spiroplasma clarkii]|uniref:hypothetical protein n=1 Tax=Spiroplasma clarkii TaxID=2139 RepID=UPI000B56BB13|nr:hypothetical protein [Spiroplasma clarkii]ARU91509.1 hypothetical protein SCLARK_00900 [Spiroplasma clarkii]